MNWEVLALRYGTAEMASAHLGIDHDLHEGSGRLDYFFWVIRNEDAVILVDTGFQPDDGAQRKRTLLQHPIDALASVGIGPDEVQHVVITHLHYDHAGNLELFPNARFHLQDVEMEYATGRCMCHSRMRKPFSLANVQSAVKLVFEERVDFHRGDFELAPGITVHLVGGHSRGLQVIRVSRPEGIVVVASDALHLERYLTDEDIFPMFSDYQQVVEGYQRLRALSGPNGIILPGHDLAVVTRYQRYGPDLENVVVIR